jgi:hypothetical protein
MADSVGLTRGVFAKYLASSFFLLLGSDSRQCIVRGCKRAGCIWPSRGTGIEDIGNVSPHGESR